MSDNDLLTTAEAAALLRRPVGTLRQWRYNNRGPRSFRVGGRTVYRRSAIVEYIEKCEAATGTGGEVA